jgi:replicative DNA helicase
MELKTSFNSKQFQRREVQQFDISSTMYGMVPPQAKELEEAVLGAILLEKRAFDIAAEILKPESFYVDANQRIFKAMCFLDSNQQPIDMLTVIEALKLGEELDLVGGPYYITKLTNNVVSAANIETHARIVLQKFIQRELIRLSGETITAAYNDSTDCFDLLDQHEKTLAEITTGNIKSNFTDTVMVGAEEINRLYDLQKNPTNLTGITTGYSILNHLTGGWQPTDLIIIAGRPSVGKTALALNFLRNAATSVPVGMFSLEMGKNQLMRRMLCAESGIWLDKLNNGKMTADELTQIVMANDRINKMKIYIDDTGGMDIYELRSKARRMVSKHKCKLIIIDYLQLMSGEGNKTQNREQEISSISRKLKALAKELKVPVIALSQMSRDIEKRKGEPMLSDLRESGAIEQDADMVIFGFRDDYQHASIGEDIGEISNGAYLKISKHRNGALDKLAFKTDMRVQTWFDLNQWDKYNGSGMWRKIESNKDGSTLYIQKGSKMSDPDEGAPF